ncbi:hypothetical protein ACRYCC_13325 [Actinomadura scrupuli]|uniref:hypothetical protein n=1 Tax=Actinomadura scrupuli TaxID=559629 RepID=UPI003D9964C7
MPYYRVSRMSCGGLLAQIVLVVILGVVGLICFANRSWFEAKAINAVYGDSSKIHAGAAFRPGATAVEDGVRQTAVLIAGAPHVQVSSPTAEWRERHKDAVCSHGICTAAATPKSFGSGFGSGTVFGGLLGGLLLSYVVWVMVVGDSPSGRDYRD